jgi:acyl carrier protein
VPVDGVYAALASRGFALGPSMRCLETIHAGDGELLVSLALPEGGDEGHVLSPALLDAAAHSVVALGLASDRSAGLFLGLGIGEIVVHARPGARAIAYVRLRAPLRDDAEVVRFDVILANDDGSIVAEISDFSAKRAQEPGARAILGRPPIAAPAPVVAVVAAPPLEPSRSADESDISTFFRAELARRLRLDAARIPAATPLSRLGVDSLMAVDVLATAARRFGVRLSPTLLFEHGTLDAITRAVAAEARRARG